MESFIGPLLLGVDKNMVLIVAAIVGLAILLSIVKKAFKLAIFCVVLIVLVAVVGKSALTFQEDYNIQFIEESAVIKVKGTEYTINSEICKGIKLTSNGINGYSLDAQFEDGRLQIDIPTFMAPVIKEFGERMEIQVIYTE